MRETKSYKSIILYTFLLFTSSIFAQQTKTWSLDEIPIRDPYILPVEADCTYYLYSATRGEVRGPKGRHGVCTYTSKDLKTWEGPFIVFENPDGFWADPEHGIWAPEVHHYKEKFYLFATFTNPSDTIEVRPEGFAVENRATQIMVSESPLGPFKPFNLERGVTPKSWMTLDGTLWEEDGKPYMIFCHEWIQVNEGTFELVEMTSDLSAMAGEPTTIFKTNDAKWVRRMDLLGKKYKGNAIPGFVSDGPFIHQLPSGKLICLTSSFSDDGYSLSYAVSKSGKLVGPWSHPKKPLLTGGHGHGMLFKTFEGELLLTCHYPNKNPSRSKIYRVKELNDGIEIIGEYK